MHTSNLHTVLALLAATAGTYAQSTSTATVLVPYRCVTQATPTVTVVAGQSDLTTYSYICPTATDSAAAYSSASAKASSIWESARSRVSAARSNLGVEARATGKARRDVNESLILKRQGGGCFGWDNDVRDACVPWEVTQGPSTWAVHYTRSGTAALDQECTFGSGGVSSGVATCTGSGRLDPSAWGGSDGTQTRTFSKSDVDRFWVRNTVAVTSGGSTAATDSGGSTTGTVTGSARSTAAGASAAVSTGAGVALSTPVGVAAMAIGAANILVAALVL